MVQLELDEFYLESPSIFKPEIILLGHEFELKYRLMGLKYINFEI